jgi:hypothetical protein
MSNPTTVQFASRRLFLAANGLGVGSVALAWMLNQERAFAKPAKPELERRSYDASAKAPGAAPRATAMISMFMQGGPSHLDLFDPKPELTRLDGKPFPGEVKYDNAAEASSKVLGSPWRFDKCGQSGADVSELLPHFARIVDDVTILRGMHTDVNNHGQSILAMNSGQITPGRPGLGSWLTYGLGAESQNLPAFVVLTDPDGLPVEGVRNWTNGGLPSLFQGTVVRPREPRILNLDAPATLAGKAQEKYLSYLSDLNREHLDQRPGELDLEARIRSYELAARMQTAAKEALDISQETEATQKLYGIDAPATREYGTRCLIARRLIERGVRFVQIFTRYQFWDHHGNILKSLPAACLKVDQPGAALVTDLKQRGLLDTTLVHWGGEMGRLPVVQNEKNIGRDHNTYGFTMWLAGGGVKSGLTYGSTDEFGHRAAENKVSHTDYHRTLLRLFGLDPAQLLFARGAQKLSLVDPSAGRIVQEILA